MCEVILNTVPKKRWEVRTSAVQEIRLQNYLLLFLRTTPSVGEGGSEEDPKAGAMLAFLLNDCALHSGGNSVFSKEVNA
jgi:hypothetical protein